MSTTYARRGPLIPTIVIAGLLIVGFLVFSEIWTEKLWFDSVSYQTVFTTQLFTRVWLFVVFFLVMAGLVGLNMWLAFRMRPLGSRSGSSQVLERYADLLASNLTLSLLLPAAFFGVIGGMTAQAATLDVLAWLNRTPFGEVDPYFGLDIGFYVFELPIWRDLLGFAMSALFFALIGAAAVHFTVGGIQLGRGAASGSRPSAARRHLSILAGLLLVVYGLQSLVDRYAYLVADGTIFTGLHYTDDHARLGAKLVMAVIAFICAALFFLNAFVNRWVLPVTGLVLMLVSGLILQLIYPAIVQSFQVSPNEPDKEGTYMQHHIDATRKAFGISEVETTAYDAVTDVRPGQLKEDAEALPGIRLIDPARVGAAFEQLQQVRGYYSFPDVLDVDRYVVDGVERDMVVAAREMNLNNVPDKAWNNIHTVYTHGYGMVAAYGNRRQSDGQPEWVERDLPPSGALGEYEGRIYFGEKSDQFAIVGREPGQAPIELDTPGGGKGGGEQYNVYAGTGGVPIGSIVNRLLYAAHFMDLNFLLSDRVNSQSKLLYNRTPRERVEQVAPWLTLDNNSYPAVVDGRLVWIVDAYTTSRSYPNSELVGLRQSTSDSQTRTTGATGLDQMVNYLRNSVKAVVDASNGTVALYAWDESDPILQTYAKAFPGTVQPKDAISPDLLAHLRYPEDLFKVQREILRRYHMTDPASWYQQSDLWQVPNDPVTNTGEANEPPYYLSIKWPTDDAPVFSQTSVFVPRGRSNLASYLAVVAEATSPDYGKLRVLRMSDTHQIDGPGQTFNAMTANSRVAEVLRPYLNQGSAAASYGNLLTLPMGAGLLYVLPVYTQRQGSNGSYPVLTYVIVRFGQSVGIGATLQEALDETFKGDAGAETGENPVDPVTP
ncbi:MAG: UPF0182 family protein, partial [Propionicimonas sp.]|nr:UPF0182 family protein [Propionicimonas sp.]